MDQDDRIALARLKIIGLDAVGVRGRAYLRVLASCHGPLHPGEHTCGTARVARGCCRPPTSPCPLPRRCARRYHPRGWYRDGERMTKGEGEKTEKITINLGLVDLGQIDLLVQEGFYTNRTDFIRTAIRTQLASRGEALDQTAARRTLTLGSCHYARRDLEEIRDTGQMIHIRVLGLASIAADVSPQLALATIASVEVLGAFRAPVAVKAALAPRTA